MAPDVEPSTTAPPDPSEPPVYPYPPPYQAGYSGPTSGPQSGPQYGGPQSGPPYGLPQSGSPVAGPYIAPPYQAPPAQYYYAVPLEEDQRGQCEAAVRRVLTNELRSLPTKLAVANERLFDQYDRLSAEASLRLNLAPAFVVLVGLLMWRLSFWTVFGLVVPALLVVQAMGKLRAANDLLIQAVVTQAIQSTEVLTAGRYVVEQSRDPDPRSSPGDR